MTTVAQLLADATDRLRLADVGEPRLDARVLLAHVLELESAALSVYPDRDVPDSVAGPYAALVARRVAREPVAHLTGCREFWSRMFAVGPDVLDPRPDSETLIEAVLDHVGDRRYGWRIADLGVGSGCLLLTVLGELPGATGVGADVSVAALRRARSNARTLGFDRRAAFVRSDWSAGLAGPFDVVLCNPPYIPSADIETLAPEVARHEPRGAFDGGPDGLACYRSLVPDLPRVLAPGGLAVVEIGVGQSDAVAALLDAAGLCLAERRRDLGGRERCLVARRPGVAVKQKKRLETVTVGISLKVGIEGGAGVGLRVKAAQ